MWTKIKASIVKRFVKYLGNIQIEPSPLFLTLNGNGYKIKGETQREVIDTLKMGDILLRRWDGYISNWFIPGYWSHAGVYVGNNKVVHATPSKGVHEEDILGFLRADSIAVLRVPNMTELNSGKIIRRSREILGRNYDHAFEGMDNEMFYCFEVVAYVLSDFEQINIKRENTILAKNILASGLEKVYEYRSK